MAELTELSPSDIIIFLRKAQSRLAETDYVVVKLSEAQILRPETVDELKQHYATVLEERERCRNEIRNLEAQLSISE